MQLDLKVVKRLYDTVLPVNHLEIFPLDCLPACLLTLKMQDKKQFMYVPLKKMISIKWS